MMEFVLTFQQPQAAYELNADPLQGPPALHAWQLYMEAMAAAGIMRGGNRLDALNATTVKVREGKRQVEDGPFAGTKAILGGYVVIDVPSLDEALLWAERSPSAALGATEVWPVKPPGKL
jgi:hypothetical protein